MNIITDARNTVIVDGLRVGRLVREGTTLAFYVPPSGGFSQRLLAWNGITLPQSRQARALDALTQLRRLLETEGG
jgi:hypothetical protein